MEFIGDLRPIIENIYLFGQCLAAREYAKELLDKYKELK